MMIMSVVLFYSCWWRKYLGFLWQGIILHNIRQVPRRPERHLHGSRQLWRLARWETEADRLLAAVHRYSHGSCRTHRRVFVILVLFCCDIKLWLKNRKTVFNVCMYVCLYIIFIFTFIFWTLGLIVFLSFLVPILFVFYYSFYVRRCWALAEERHSKWCDDDDDDDDDEC